VASDGIAATPAPQPRTRRRRPRVAGALGGGALMLYLSGLVLLPLAALAAHAFDNGLKGFWDTVTTPEGLHALEFTLGVSVLVVLVNVVMGTLIAWVLVRDDFPGRTVINTIIDLPFALPTIVVSVVLLALYGKNSPIGIDLALTKAAVAVALLFVTLPFVVRSVQPVLIELDRSMEEAAASLGASPSTVIRRVVLPALAPAIISGAALSFARAVGEFGSVILFGGALPNKTEVASIYVYNQVENDNLSGAAAVSVVLLVISLIVLGALNWLSRRQSRHVG
jgi:sulfate transport system permease protein